MAYADYTYYSGTFLGTAIVSADFAALAFRASAVIDAITFARAEPIVTAATETTVIAAIKNAMCAVAEELQRQDANNADGIQSESQGQYSVSFAVNSSRMKTNQTKLEDAARLWLANTGLMFAGFNTGEYGSTIDDT
jgi:hypothetical protein